MLRDPAWVGGDYREICRMICEGASEIVGVARVGIWLYNKERSSITCSNLYSSTDGNHSEGATLLASDHPAYFGALEEDRLVAAGDAQRDPRTSEFTEGYLIPQGIGALLDAPILVRGVCVGVVCNEHVGSAREWSPEDKIAAVSIADMTALAIELDRSRKAEHERLELERQVLHAQKLESLGVLAGGIAHDFNNLLSVILGNAELALSELPDGSPLNPYLEDIRDIGIQAGDLAAQMLAYSGKGSFRVRPIDISTVLGELSRLIQSTISKKVSVEIDLAQAVPLVEADVTQIRQVMLNLIINASDAIGNNAGLIRLSTRTIARGDPSLAQDQFFGHPMGAGEYVCLEVSDSGCGMTQAVMEKLFDPFFTTKRTGRGLGMSAALGIARGHGGCFAIASEPGTGTRLKLLLPSSAHASPKHAELPA